MHGEASLASARLTREAWAGRLQEQDEHALDIARQLLDITAVLDDNTRLQRELTDPGRATDERVALVHTIFGGRVDDLSEQILCSLVRKRWSNTMHLVNYLEYIAV